MIENSKKPIPVLVSGALGRMGSEVVNAVLNSKDCELVAAIDINEKNTGSNISELLKVKIVMFLLQMILKELYVLLVKIIEMKKSNL